MANSLQEIFRKKLVPITFERTIGLFGATTIGVGALMGAGVYVLIGLAAGVAGPSVWISYVICGGLAFLSTLLFAELARLVPISGGGYAYAYDALGRFGGFFTGWFLALGSIFACGLYALGFAEYLMTLLGMSPTGWRSKMWAVLLVLFSTWLNAKGTEGADRIQNLLTWGNLGVLVIFLVASVFYIQPELSVPSFPKGYSGTFSAIGIIYISFFGYQLIGNSADEIKNPTSIIPKAMKYAMGIAFVFYLAVALVAILVVPWEKLAQSNAPLVDVASISLGRYGWLLISVGGVLAAGGALNSTLLSQGRQIYAMGKDRFFPDLLGKIHELAKTPRAAILAGGIGLLLALIFFPIAFMAKAANFCLLMSMLPVSLALRKIYMYSQDLGPISWWKRLLPGITFVVNLGLLLTLDWMSLLFGIQLGGIGILWYFFYARKRVVRSEEGLHIQLLETNQTASGLLTGERILMPMANPNTQRHFLSICEALLANKKGEIVALHIIQAPNQVDFRTALSDAEKPLALFERITEKAKAEQVRVVPVIRAAHHLGQGIVHAAEEEGCDITVMGYSGQNASPKAADLMEYVLNQARTNFIFLKILDAHLSFQPKRIAVSLGGRLNLELMVRLGGALASKYGGTITFLNILPEDFTTAEQAESGKIFIEAIQKHSERALYNIQVLASNHPIDTLVEQSQQFDLLIVGTTKVGFLQRMVVGNFATQITERAHCDVAIVRVLPISQRLVKGI